MQRAWNKYGEEKFEFKVIHNNIPLNEIDDWEIYYINEIYNTFKGEGYNCHIGGNNHVGENNPRFGCKLKEETKKKISDSLAGNEVSKQARKKISLKAQEDKNSSSIVDIEMARKILNDKKYLNLTIHELGNKYGLHCDTISKITSKKHWTYKYLQNEFNFNVINYKLTINEAQEVWDKKHKLNKTYSEILKDYGHKVSHRYLTRICQGIHPLCDFINMS